MHSIDTEVWKTFPRYQLEVDELKHLIRKLRWMGLEQEAESACAELSRLAPAATIHSGPYDTD